MPKLAKEFDICWLYLSTEPDAAQPDGWLGRPLIGSAGPLKDIIQTGAILAGWQFKAWRRLLFEIRDARSDAYWIVSHNEGLALARDLARLSSRPVHLTVHDDWSGALCARSRRYRMFPALADQLSAKVLRRVTSVDVISKGMKSYYAKKFGVDADVVHRPIAPIIAKQRYFQKNEILIGHLGSFYAKNDFLVFLQALGILAARGNLSAKVILWGPNLRRSDVPPFLSHLVEHRPTTDESTIIAALERCQFAYAAYPFAEKLQCFSRTSLPTKLSTYVAAGCPILGHARCDSTLASFLRETRVGVLWRDLDVDHGISAIKSVLGLKPSGHAWDNAASTFFGERNIQKMRKFLFKATNHSLL